MFVANKHKVMNKTLNKKRLPLYCPSCSAKLLVSKMVCLECQTEVCGEYKLPVLAQLAEKEQQFVLDFVKSSGSLKDMATSMGVRYPTVRTILDDLIVTLNNMEQQ